LNSCRRRANKLALLDASNQRRVTYAEYGEMVERLARGFVAAGLKPGEVVAIFLPNSWEFAATYHAATLAGGFPTLLNPTYREREVRYQLENSGAALLISDGPLLAAVQLDGIASLRRVYVVRQQHQDTEDFQQLLRTTSLRIPEPAAPPEQTLAALPYSSGTTGLPKGVMLSHFNLVANVFQTIGPHAAEMSHDDIMLCFLPLYHIYGLNVALNPMMTLGGTIVLLPRFNVPQLLELLVKEGVTMMPVVPPALNALNQAAEAGHFPQQHCVRWVKSG